jgi:cellulose synthase/poly-beta-1,6-N-acetylglucosamine synthase-like glycosyltransferase/peptidoglycan/xylan/chitin deacetylase (PgdA/CDA1 family)/spore germination protein YaaH
MTPQRQDHVFFDPSGRRRKAVNRLGTAIGLALAVASTVFLISLLAVPFLPKAPITTATAGPGRAAPGVSRREARLTRHLAHRTRFALFREIEASRRTPAAPPKPLPPASDPIVAAFYVIWQPGGVQALRDHAERLTHVMPEWLHLNRNGTGLDFRDWDPEVTMSNRDVVSVAKDHHLAIMPVFNNAEGGVFDAERAHVALATAASRGAIVGALRDFLVEHDFQGINVDLENLRPEDYPKLPLFVSELRDVLRDDSLGVSVDLEAPHVTELGPALAAVSDFVVLMSYAEHAPAGAAGPLAGIGWFDTLLTRAAAVVPAEKLVVGIGNYAVDWPLRGGSGRALTVQSALVTARDARPDDPPASLVDFDATELNPTFGYTDAAGVPHEVWALDGVTGYNQLVLAARSRARGAALWVLGSEDPSLWPAYGKAEFRKLPPPVVMDSIPTSYIPAYSGEGEILSVGGLPRRGVRKVDLDAQLGLLTDESYQEFPSPFVIRRSGYRPGLLALTFDDGPDDVYTPEILDELQRLDARATFFVVGQNVERYPDVVRRMYEEGHEIGNHTFSHPNMATVSQRRGTLELNATLRALQATIGHGTNLFRVPYNIDAEPGNLEEARALVLASSLGYVTVGEQLDPQDWNLWKTGGAGQRMGRATVDLVTTILYQARTVHGNVILLHSAGGDRSHTVAALAEVIPLLRREGFRFVTVSELIGTTRDAVMPPVARRDLLVVGLDRVTFNVLFVLETLLAVGFTVAIGLAIARVAVIIPLAVVADRRARRRTFDPAFLPSVSVLVAAFNEEPVIARTVRSVLASDYPDLEVIVVDDGSTDGTAAAVDAEFAGEPRVRLLRQPNGGKASALNRALTVARGEVLVAFDADTMVAPDAVRLLARHFEDPQVAAVAGNVKVGNRVNAFTIWQSIEYISSQNLDRRANAMLNGVTVVHGAIGAWRRSAVVDAGGYLPDTLAEDMELTWRLRRAGWRITADLAPVGRTEAPATVGQFLRQRHRWAFGSLQVLWKHRGVLFRYGWFGWVAVPSVWLFQILFQTLGPLVDLQVLYAVANYVSSVLLRAALHQDWQPLPQVTHALLQTAFFYALFFVVDLAAAFVAFRLDRERLRDLWWLFLQRFVYRQTLYYVLWKSVVSALKGRRRGWGKLRRMGTVAAAHG